MSKIIITKGLPASGKSTWAKEQVLRSGGKMKRINKDDLRAMLDAGQWSKHNERFVLQIRDAIIIQALTAYMDVVIDDTNLDPKHEEHIRNIVAAHSTFHSVQVVNFDVTLEECIRRDAERGEKSVGSRVICDMYERYLKAKEPAAPPVFDPKLPLALVCDLDGTLAHMQGRGPYDWSRVGEDAFDETIHDLIRGAQRQGYKLLVVSGRDEVCRRQTEEWIIEHRVFADALFMRPEGDKRKDTVVKEEIYQREIAGKYNVVFVLDDRDQVVKMWRGLGIRCLQVAEGSF